MQATALAHAGRQKPQTASLKPHTANAPSVCAGETGARVCDALVVLSCCFRVCGFRLAVCRLWFEVCGLGVWGLGFGDGGLEDLVEGLEFKV